MKMLKSLNTITPADILTVVGTITGNSGINTLELDGVVCLLKDNIFRQAQTLC